VQALSLALTVENSSGIIAEFKRKSPSKGWIHAEANATEVVKSYAIAGVAGISCLTDNHFFGGGKLDFEGARQAFQGPILRKDFIIDSYQIHESKAMGADVILLIASILTKSEIIEFTTLAHELGMEVLLELHGKNEVSKIYNDVDLIGVNNRDLKTFNVSVEHSIEMKHELPRDKILISESGLKDSETVHKLYNAGYRGFLMGEYFMKYKTPGKTAKAFIQDLQIIKSYTP
jgi:indole-3-glycerol phosphate synthase